MRNPPRCPTESETGQSAPEASRCTLAIVQTYLRFGLSGTSFLAFHDYMENLNAEMASQSRPTPEEPSFERHR